MACLSCKMHILGVEYANQRMSSPSHALTAEPKMKVMQQGGS